MRKTRLTTSASEAARFIIDGGIVAFPTETVYGLGANVFNEFAIEKVFEAKRRPADNPLIAHVSSIGQIPELADEVTDIAGKLIKRFFPGPLTVVLKKNEAVPDIATAGLNSIGIRMPGLPLTQEFLRACAVPVVAPSANFSGRPSPTTWQAVYEDLNGRIDCILQGDPTEIGLESTVVDCRGAVPIVLRLGAVSLEMLRAVVPETERFVDESPGEAPSPGLRHKHYSPRAKVVRINSPSEISNTENAAYIGIDKWNGGLQLSLAVDSTDVYARELYEFFRECDRRGIERIYCQTVDRTGIGAALMDRIERAASED
jgi:L-threonylcarbamoyladenylate synthase